MSRRDWSLLIEDMLEAIGKIEAYLAGYDEGRFQADSRTVDAVVRNLEVLGEAANALPAAIQATAPAVDWRGLLGLRNRLIHEYFGVSLSAVWVIATQELLSARLQGSPQRRQLLRCNHPNGAEADSEILMDQAIAVHRIHGARVRLKSAFVEDPINSDQSRRDIDHIRQDLLTAVGLDGVRRHQVNFHLKQLFEAVGQVDELQSNRLSELHQNIEIAGLGLFPTGIGAKYPQLGHLIASTKLLPMGVNDVPKLSKGLHQPIVVRPQRSERPLWPLPLSQLSSPSPRKESPSTSTNMATPG